MYGREDLVDELTRDDCWRRIRWGDLGRLALGHGPSIEIFPRGRRLLLGSAQCLRSLAP